MKILLGVALLALAGCSTYSASRYSVAADNVTALRAFRGQTINVGAFTAAEPGRTEIRCRAVGPITTMGGEPFEQFIRKALIDELKMAEVFSPEAPVTLTGYLEHVDFVSGHWANDAAWTIALTVMSSNGRRLSVREDHHFLAIQQGDAACLRTAQALMPAVQDLVGKLVRHPDFGALVTP